MKSLFPDLKHRQHIARDVGISGLSRLVRQIAAHIPNLEYDLARVGVRFEGSLTTHELIEAKCSSQSVAVGAIITSRRARVVRKRRVEEVHERRVIPTSHRSEERRVGKECRSRWSPY